MTRHRTPITAALVALTFAAVVPTASHANPLLSGYGGPGQGNQAILGSALLNGGGSGGSGGSPLAASPSDAESVGGGSQPATGAGGSKRKSGQTSGQAGKGSASSSRAHRPSTASRTAVVGDISQPLGLSGTDLLYLFLAAGALVLTAAITRRMARRAD
jgi:hypothetical protein